MCCCYVRHLTAYLSSLKHISMLFIKHYWSGDRNPRRCARWLRKHFRNFLNTTNYVHCHHLSLILFIVQPSLVAVLFLYHIHKNAGLRGHNSVNNFYVDQYMKERGSNPWLVSSCVLCGPVYCGLTWQILGEYDV